MELVETFIVIASSFNFSENPASITSSQVLMILWTPLNKLPACQSVSECVFLEELDPKTLSF